MAEWRRTRQEIAAQASSVNSRMLKMHREYRASIQAAGKDASAQLAAESALHKARLDLLKRNTEEVKQMKAAQRARTAELRKADKQTRLIASGKGAVGSSSPGNTSAPSSPTVQVDGSGTPRELEFSGAAAQQPAAAQKKSFREQVLEEVRRKLGLSR